MIWHSGNGSAKSLICILLPLVLWAFDDGMCQAEAFRGTQLLNVHMGSARSDLVGQLRYGGYELSDGRSISFDRWYTPRLPDMTILFLTEMTDDFGLVWGLSSGEVGEKYRINPAFHVGFSLQTELFRNATLSLNVDVILGGHLRERSCHADYGTFGIAEVNCRLAASVLPPAESLNDLLNVSARREDRISLTFEYRF